MTTTTMQAPRAMAATMENAAPTPVKPAAAPAARANGSTLVVPRPPREWWDSQRLLGSRGEIKIRHHGEVYSLRVTRLGKLILTK